MRLVRDRSNASPGHDRVLRRGAVGDGPSLPRDFAFTAQVASTIEDLKKDLVATTRMLGFDYVALTEHGNLADPVRAPILLSNYPQAWREQFKARRFDRIDPVQLACRHRAAGFRWSTLGLTEGLQPRQLAVFEEARTFGLGEGFTVPLHLPGARAASCSFAVRNGEALPGSALCAAEVVAHSAFERLRSLGPKRAPPGLSPQQRACVALLAAGLTDRGIARRLALSEETVTKYLNAARRRYGLARRTQLVAVALRDGMVGYEDLMLD